MSLVFKIISPNQDSITLGDYHISRSELKLNYEPNGDYIHLGDVDLIKVIDENTSEVITIKLIYDNVLELFIVAIPSNQADLLHKQARAIDFEFDESKLVKYNQLKSYKGIFGRLFKKLSNYYMKVVFIAFTKAIQEDEVQ